MGHGKTAGKQPENTRNTRKTVKTAVFRVFRVFFRLFFGCFTVTHSAPFSAVFRLFSMSGIWHLCSWPRRLQPWNVLLCNLFCGFYKSISTKGLSLQCCCHSVCVPFTRKDAKEFALQSDFLAIFDQFYFTTKHLS